VLTIFTHPKAFRGRTATIQRNALGSWLLLHPDVQIILFGDAVGAQEVAWEFGLHYEESPELTARGAIRLDYMLATALRRARHDVLCYLPCDTLLLPEFCSAFNRVEALYREFVMVGRSHTLDSDAWDDLDSHTELKPRCERLAASTRRAELGYLVFSRGCFQSGIAALSSDTPAAMNWLLRKAIAEKLAVVDASQMAVAVQQREGAPAEEKVARTASIENFGEEELLLMGDYKQLRHAVCAPLLLTAEDVIPNRWVRLRRWHASLTRGRTRIFRDWGELSLGIQKTPALPAVEVQRHEDRRPSA
jgi:hypothetical protein